MAGPAPHGGVRVYDGTSLHHIAFIPLKRDTDSIAYDPKTKYLYVVNGGGDANETFSMYRVIDTTQDTMLAEVKVDGDTLEASAVDPSSPRIFVNNPAKNEVDVINRDTRSVESVWPFHGDEECRDGSGQYGAPSLRGVPQRQDSTFGSDGQGIETLDIGKGVDDLIFYPASRRIYASTGAGTGSTVVYEEQDPDHYQLLAGVATAPGAKNEVLVPELDRYFTVVPPTQSSGGFVYAYRVSQ